MRKISLKKRIIICGICSMMTALSACVGKVDPGTQASVSGTSLGTAIENSGKTSADVTANPTPTPLTESGFSADADLANKDLYKAYQAMYSNVLDGYYAGIAGDLSIDNYIPMTMGVFEITADNTLNNIGFAFEDINADDIPELLIMELSDSDAASHQGKRILAMYTQVKAEVRFVAGGWARNRYYLLDDGRIRHEGSSGADDSIDEICRLIENSDKLEVVDSEDLLSQDIEQHMKMLELKTFAEYEISSDYPTSAKAFWSAVYVKPVEETYVIPGGDSYTADTSEYARKLSFYTPSEVSDFKFNALTLVDSGEGKMIFEERELYSLESLVMDKEVLITMAFMGDIPNYGISYKDAAGNVRRFAIGESGFDGSIFLIEYEIGR